VKKEVSIDEFVEILREYFEFFSEEVRKRMNPLRLVSISSLKEKGAFGVIGIVKSIKDENDYLKLELEDKTGSISVIIDKKLVKHDENQIFPDEVIGVEGIFEKNRLIAERIVFPEINEVKQVNFDKESVLYARNDIESIRININGKIFAITTPTVIFVDELNVLVAPNPQNLNPKLFLKKRTLAPGRISLSQIIKVTPHLFITTHTPSFRETYKGTKIIGLDSKEEIRIKLKNMEEIV
jgi:DNA polymerase II small subunit/DNA polymerase delta subunit B